MTTLEELASRLDNPLGEIELSAKPVPAEEPKLTINKPEDVFEPNVVDFESMPHRSSAGVADAIKRAERHYGRATLNSLMDCKRKSEEAAEAVMMESERRKMLRWAITVISLMSSGVMFFLSVMPVCDDSKSFIPRRAEVAEKDLHCKDSILWSVCALSVCAGVGDAVLNLTSVRSNATRLRDVARLFKSLAGELREAIINTHPDEPANKTLQRFLTRFAQIDTAYEKSGVPQPSAKTWATAKRKIVAKETVDPTIALV
jgi:hypothetical protein